MYNDRSGNSYLLVSMLLLLFLANCAERLPETTPVVKTGLDRIASGEVTILQGLRVGVITNQTGVTRDGRRIADILAADPNVDLLALFGPEHGIHGDTEAGAHVNPNRDPKTNVPVYSLYGTTRKPTAAMLAGLDALVFDIQDIGTRFYTYISSMTLAMEAAAEHGIRFIVLDRPNPIGGHMVEGAVLDTALRSFVGIHPIPQRHGMTVGELAKMFNEEGWLKNGIRADLTVVPCVGWHRNMVFADYGDTWIPPSPNIPNANAALLYAGIGLVEALANFSEGRGTNSPFELVGAPWLDSRLVIRELEKAQIPGVQYSVESFTPVDVPGKATGNKFSGRLCNGIRFEVTEPRVLPSVRLGIELLTTLRRLYPDTLKIRKRSLNRLTGQRRVYEMLMQNAPADSIVSFWQPEYQRFLEMRKNYLLYH